MWRRCDEGGRDESPHRRRSAIPRVGMRCDIVRRNPSEVVAHKQRVPWNLRHNTFFDEKGMSNSSQFLQIAHQFAVNKIETGWIK